VKIMIPCKTVSEANAREHWAQKAKRAAAQRGLALLLCRAELGTPPPLPLRIRMVRISPRGFDTDNLAGSQKHLRDGIADWLGIDDRDPRVEWVYLQERAKGPATRVEIENTGPVVIAGRCEVTCA
jgi:hypothetical protein